MRTVCATGLLLLVATAAQPAFAQGDEIVVTASRYVERYENVQPPHVAITRRADFVVQSVGIESDTRDLGGRRTELAQILNELQSRSRNGAVSVALIEESEDDAGETRVKPFTAALAQALIRNGGRPDTSGVSILLRTAIQPTDTLETVEARLDGFIRTLPKPGRVSLSSADVQLTITDPGQYRRPIIAAIATDAKQATDALGPGYGVRVSGLESRIAWRRAGDLELMLYIPHKIEITPPGVR